MPQIAISGYLILNVSIKGLFVSSRTKINHVKQHAKGLGIVLKIDDKNRWLDDRNRWLKTDASSVFPITQNICIHKGCYTYSVIRFYCNIVQRTNVFE